MSRMPSVKYILRARRNVLRTDGGEPTCAFLRPVPCFLASVSVGRYSQHRVVGMMCQVTTSAPSVQVSSKSGMFVSRQRAHNHSASPAGASPAACSAAFRLAASTNAARARVYSVAQPSKQSDIDCGRHRR